MRTLILVAYVITIYYIVQVILRWLLQVLQQPAHADTGAALSGEMLLDPECRIYIQKERALTRMIQGGIVHFCSEDCATAHATKNRG
ncbi:MAG: hypothetical protein AABZ44_09260 [Elusimicrobiota bacterium]